MAQLMTVRSKSRFLRTCLSALFLTLLASQVAVAADNPLARGRQVLRLDGQWQITQGSKDQIPAVFDHVVPVPGLVDMAQPPFVGVGETNDIREAFWYRRTFTLPGDVPPVGVLKLGKAAYSAKVWLNGRLIGEHLPSFTPALFDVQPTLRNGSRTNEIIVRVLAHRRFLPPGIPGGWDFEKLKYIPGLFDSVELILSGTPHIVRVQTVPDIVARALGVQVVLKNDGLDYECGAEFVVREAKSRKVVGRGRTPYRAVAHGEEKTFTANILLTECRLWTPEDPFLYELETTTGPDTTRTRFGMRSFHLDPKSGRAVLNGQPLFLRGSNVTLYRFFEDGERLNRPWDAAWVRALHRKFKEMHWNSLRYCIGFAPEQWYDIADEEGILIQDEYPLWHLSGERFVETWPKGLDQTQLAREYTEWMQERWNHPCVVIWDAQNETATPETGKALQAVRQLDLSNRPWDNGWAEPQAPGDSFESHPYFCQNPDFKFPLIAHEAGTPTGNITPNKGGNPIILNEYGWLWLNRDGAPTTLTRQLYANLLGDYSTTGQRRYTYARWLAAETEFWRAHRACFGVLHFCGLGYSRPNGQTSDNFINLATLEYEPYFKQYVGDAFAPVGLMLDFWQTQLPLGIVPEVPVIVINDTPQPWEGDVHLTLLREGRPVQREKIRCLADPLGRQTLVFNMKIPVIPGAYRLIGELGGGALKPGVRSVRDFMVVNQP